MRSKTVKWKALVAVVVGASALAGTVEAGVAYQVSDQGHLDSGERTQVLPVPNAPVAAEGGSTCLEDSSGSGELTCVSYTGISDVVVVGKTYASDTDLVLSATPGAARTAGGPCPATRGLNYRIAFEGSREGGGGELTVFYNESDVLGNKTAKQLGPLKSDPSEEKAAYPALNICA